MENTWNLTLMGTIFYNHQSPKLKTCLLETIVSPWEFMSALLPQNSNEKHDLMFTQADQIRIIIFPILYEACSSRRKVSWCPVWYPIGVNSVKLKWETGLLFGVWLGLIWRKEVNGRLLSGGPWNNQTFNRPHIWSELGCRLGSPHISMLLPAQLVPDNFLRMLPSPHYMPVFRTCLNFKLYFHHAVEKECKSAFQEAMIGRTSFELLHPLSGKLW